MSLGVIVDKLDHFFLGANNYYPPNTKQLKQHQFNAHTATIALEHAGYPPTHKTSTSYLTECIREHNMGKHLQSLKILESLDILESLTGDIRNAIKESLIEAQRADGQCLKHECSPCYENLSQEGEKLLKDIENARRSVQYRLAVQSARYDETSTPPYRVRTPFRDAMSGQSETQGKQAVQSERERELQHAIFAFSNDANEVLEGV